MQDFDFFTRKGVFSYIDCVKKLEDMRLSLRESFFSSLVGDYGDTQYSRAISLTSWTSGSASLFELSESTVMYLKIDVFLLVDIFENFRESCNREYNLDPAHYYILPGFIWDVNAEIYVHKIWVAHRHRYSSIHQAWYTRWPQSMLSTG